MSILEINFDIHQKMYEFAQEKTCFALPGISSMNVQKSKFFKLNAFDFVNDTMLFDM